MFVTAEEVGRRLFGPTSPGGSASTPPRGGASSSLPIKTWRPTSARTGRCRSRTSPPGPVTLVPQANTAGLGHRDRPGQIANGGCVLGTAPCCLCTNMWMTCAQRRPACAYAVEMLGIPLSGQTGTGHLPGKTLFTSCAYKENWNYPHATRAINDELAENLSQVYSVVIRRRNRETLTLEMMSPSAFRKGSPSATAANARIHLAFADGRPACPVPVRHSSRPARGRPPTRLEPGPPGRRTAAQPVIPLRSCPWAGYPSCTALISGSTGGMT
jgi:hypothetical protein